MNERRAHPGDDLVSLLIEPRGSERLTDEEIVSFAVLLMVAATRRPPT
ncbi:MAG: hypothetical protein U0V73_09315 [Acidimicrobiia bacterium]